MPFEMSPSPITPIRPDKTQYSEPAQGSPVCVVGTVTVRLKGATGTLAGLVAVVVDVLPVVVAGGFVVEGGLVVCVGGLWMGCALTTTRSPSAALPVCELAVKVVLVGIYAAAK